LSSSVRDIEDNGLVPYEIGSARCPATFAVRNPVEEDAELATLGYRTTRCRLGLLNASETAALESLLRRVPVPKPATPGGETKKMIPAGFPRGAGPSMLQEMEAFWDRGIIFWTIQRGRMPRRSAADSETSPSTSVGRRLRPPPDLSGPEKEVFLATVLACPASHFEPQDLFMVCAYVRAVCREQVASGELAAAGCVTADGRASPYLSMLKDAIRDMTVMSRLLKLNPVARQSSASTEPEPPTSYYERMRLEGRRDDGPN
jgi:phage terminase small subunit